MERRVDEFYRTVAGFDRLDRDVTAEIVCTGSLNHTFDVDQIISFDYSGDIFSVSDAPIGNVTSNELTVEILGRYDLAVGDKLVVYLSEELSGVTGKLCTVYVYDCKYDLSTDVSTVTAYDWLYDLLSDTPNYGMVRQNIKLSTVINYIFELQGISRSKLNVDPLLENFVLPYFFMQPGSFGTTLDALTTAYSFCIYVDANEILQVKSLSGIGVETTLSDSVHVINAVSDPLSIRPGTEYDVRYTEYTKVLGDEAYSTTITTVAGLNTIANVTVKDPILGLQSVQTSGDTIVSLDSIKYNQYTISTSIVASSATDLEVKVIVDTLQPGVTQRLSISSKSTLIENPYVFNMAQAQKLCEMYNRYSQQGTKISCEARMSPMYQGGVGISLSVPGFEDDYIITGNEFHYDGALSGTYTLYKKEVYVSAV